MLSLSLLLFLLLKTLSCGLGNCWKVWSMRRFVWNRRMCLFGGRLLVLLNEMPDDDSSKPKGQQVQQHFLHFFNYFNLMVAR